MAIWEEKLKELITPGASKWPYRVVQIKPNRRRDSEIYTLSGREEDIASNGSLFLALYDLIGRGKIDFEAWWEQWEAGFPLFNNSRTMETSNYLLLGNSPWRKSTTRPRYREWTTSEQREAYGYRVIEYWKDRSNEKNSIVISGTDLQIIQHIIQIEYEGGGAANAQSSAPSFEHSNKGLPLVRLYFEEDLLDIPKLPNGSLDTPLKGRCTFRLTNLTDDPSSSINKISKADVKQLAEKIKSIFGSGNGYVWQKGRKIIAYNRPDQGFKRTYYFCKTHSDGIELLTNLLALTDQTLDRRRLNKNEVDDEVGRFPVNPSPISVLGELTEQREERRIGNVRFKWAELELAKKPQPVLLVDGTAVVYAG